MAEDRDALPPEDSAPEVPPDGTRDAIQSAVSDTVLSLRDLAQTLQDRATLAGVNVAILLFQDGGPGTFAYHFARYTNASDATERAMLAMAGGLIDRGDVVEIGEEGQQA